MFEKTERRSLIGVILCFPVVLLLGCGGGGSKGVRTMQDGKVIVRNETPHQIQATVYEGTGGNPVETIVESNETKRVF